MNPKTEIIYVCSPDFRRYLFLSLRSLLTSGTDFSNTEIHVYVVTDSPVDWILDDPRIVIHNVEDISLHGSWGKYWGTNKLHLCSSSATRVVYLDTDVMVLRPLELVWEGHEESLVARHGVGTYMEKPFNYSIWNATLDYCGAAEFPHYSPGFFVLQNESHKAIFKDWMDVTGRIIKGDLPLKAAKHAEMYAFSIAAAMSNLSHAAMEDAEHRYAMIGERWNDATVFHLGTPGFYRHYLPVEKNIGLAKEQLSVPRPPFTCVHGLWTRMSHRIKSRLRRGKREASIEY